MNERNNIERDALIEEILSQVSKEKKDNNQNSTTSVNAQGENLSRANEIMASLFPEDYEKGTVKVDFVIQENKEENIQTVSEKADKFISEEKEIKPSKKEKKEKVKKEKKKKKDERNDLLSEITPWDERRKMHEGGETDSFEDMAGHKKVADFYSDLKNRASVEQEKPQEVEESEIDTFTANKEEEVEDIVVRRVEETAVVEVTNKETEENDETEDDVKVFGEESNTKEQIEDGQDDSYEYDFEPTKFVPSLDEEDTTLEELVADSETIVMDSLPSEPESEIQLKLPGFDKTPEDNIKGEFVKRRREVVEQFEVNPDALPPDEPVKIKDDEDYHGIEDADSMRLDFLLRSRQAKRGHVTTLILAIISTIITVCALPGVAVINIDGFAEIYLAVNLIMMLIAIVANMGTVFGSLPSLFKKNNPNGAAGASLGLISGLIVNMLLFIFIDDFVNSGLPLFNAFYLWAFSFVLAGEKANVNRVKDNFELVANEKVKTAVSVISNDRNAEDLAAGLVVGAPEVAVTKKGIDLKDFLYHSLAQDEGDSSSFTMSYIVIPLALICGFLCFFFAGQNKGEILYAISAYSGALAMLIPFVGIMGGGKTVAKICKIARRERVMLSGYDAAELSENVNVITVEAADLFPAGTVKLVGVKTASTQAIDRSIQDVAAVVIADGGPLSSEFKRIVEGKMAILPTVEAPVYEDGMGISGWVSGNRVLIGNKALMEHHEIYIPENNFEEEAADKGLSALYLSTEGKFAAVFFVKYSPSKKVAEDLKNAVNKGMSINVFSNDPFINHDMLCRLFSLPSKTVKLMDTSARKAYKNALSNDEELLSAVMMHTGHAGSTARVLTMGIKMKKVCRFISFIQYVLCAIAFGLSCVAILYGGAATLGMLTISGFYLLSLFLSYVLPSAFIK